MATRPTEREISRAMDYLRDRLSAETVMRDAFRGDVLEAAQRIVNISMRYNLPPRLFRFSADAALEREVEDVLEWLRERTEQREVILLPSTEEEDRDSVLASLFGPFRGSDFASRQGVLSRFFSVEVEAAVAAGLLLGQGARSIISGISRYLDTPWNNPSILSQEGRGAASGLSPDWRRYGRGTASGSFKTWSLLTTDTLARGWMEADLLQAERSGATGFYTFRGSSYPCEECEDYTLYLHPLTDALPPLHPHCVCYAAFVYE